MLSRSVFAAVGTVLSVALGGMDCAGAAPISLAQVKAFAEAEVRIEWLRRRKTVDWAAIRSDYEQTLAIVNAVDAREQTRYAAELAEALDKCEAGTAPKVNQQVLAKGLQHVAVLGIKHELDAALTAPAPGRRKGVACVAAFVEGISPTFSRRDADYFGGKKILERAADDAVAQLQAAAGEGGIALSAARRVLEDVIARTYALSVLYEVSEIEKYRDTDPAKCAVKLKEAQIFYRIIGPRIQRRSPALDTKILAILNAAYRNMSVADLERLLRAGLPGIHLK